MSSFSDLVDAVWGGPAAQKISGAVPTDHVLDSGFAGRMFDRDQAYFTISISEMFLANARKLWQGISPLTVAAIDFQYAGQRQTAPFVVGKDLLASIQEYLKGDNVEYRNTKVLGPCPYTGGNVALFVGLFQTPTNSASTEFFSVLGDIAGAFELTGLTGYLPVAKVVTGGLGKLLKLGETRLQIGSRDEFSGESGDSNRFREGFLVYVNCSPEELGTSLWVKDGTLLAGATPDSAIRLTRYDHCLARIAWNSERNDYTSLPFHTAWNKARDLVWEDQAEKARAAFLELVQQVARSPDLTPRHRVALLSAYRVNFESETESFRATTTGLAPTGNTRAASTMPGNGAGALQMEALTSRKAGFGKDVESALLNMAQKFPKLTAARAGNETLTDQVLCEQMEMIGTQAQDPQRLADALVTAAFQNA
jgi:hypothetical protein